MKRFRFRRLICASAIAVTLGLATLGGVLTQAAGPGEFISGLWDKRPKLKKVSETKLNPRNWVTRLEKDEQPGRSRLSNLVTGRTSTANLSDGQAASSTRPDLYQDPFAVSGEAEAGSTPSLARKSTNQAAPSPGQRREAQRRRLEESTTQPGTGRIVRRAGSSALKPETRDTDAPTLPDGLTVASDEKRSESGQTEGNAPASAILQPDSGNQFSPGFDRQFQRLVQSVIDESKARDTKAEKPAARAMASGRDALRGSVSAPQIPGSQSPLSGGRESVEDLIEQSRREMATTPTIPAGKDDSPLITARPGQTPISLTDGTGQTQLEILDGQPTMMVPSVQTPGGTTSAGSLTPLPGSDLRRGWGDGPDANRRAEPPSREFQRRPKRPRVISNGAPPQSVPNNQQYERMSYSEAGGPLFGKVIDNPQRAPAAGPESLEAAVNHQDPEGIRSAPIIDWSLDENSGEPASISGIPWTFVSVLVTAFTTLVVAVLLLRKRQVVTVVTSGTDAAGESD